MIPPMPTPCRSRHALYALLTLMWAMLLTPCGAIAQAATDANHLGGAWHGEFTDGSGTHRVELLLWPGRIHEVVGLVGYLRLKDSDCTVLAIAHGGASGTPALNLSASQMRLPASNCAPADAQSRGQRFGRGEARITAQDNDGTLQLTMPLLGYGLDGGFLAHCDIFVSSTDKPGCNAKGQLRRGAPSAELLALAVATPAVPPGMQRPDAQIVALLRSGEPISTATAEVVQAPLVVARNEEIREENAQLQARFEQFQRDLAAASAADEGPFEGGGSPYLNALLAGVTVRLDALDRDFRHPYVEAFSSRQYGGGLQLLGALVGAGDLAVAAQRQMVAAAENLSLVQPIALGYVLGYEHQFPATCMDAEPVLIRRERHYDGQVLSTFSGREVSRSEAYTEVREFRVNRRLAAILEHSDERLDRVTLLENLQGPAPPVRISALLSSLHQTMRRLRGRTHAPVRTTIAGALAPGARARQQRRAAGRRCRAMSETTWLFQKGGAIHSPATLANLRQLASNGAVTRDTPVWREGMTDYVEAEKVTELVDCFKPRTFHGHALR